MNLTKMFETQKGLMDRIEKEHPSAPNENRFTKRVLALLVELGEMANEQRSWKYWSHDQRPRKKVAKAPTMFEEDREYYNPLLEEFVDGEHFFIELAIELGIEPDDFYSHDEILEGTTENILIEIMHYVSMVEGLTDIEKKKRYLIMGHMVYLNLAEQRLGFSLEQIEQAYFEKNAINHQRQLQGY